MRKPGPSVAQRVVLSVLAEGGFLDAGSPGSSCPRLYEADARLFALIARSTLDVLSASGWVSLGVGPTGRPRYVVSAAGRQTARRFRP